MSCPHGNGPPDCCSQCLCHPARRVEQVGGELRLDGESPRAVDVETTASRIRYGSRGGKALHKTKER